jgi:type IV secretion system protein VirD4
MAGYGLRAFLISQSLNQIDKAYGQNHSILDNCHVRVAFATNDERTAKRISDALGTATETRAQRNYAGHRLAPWLGHLMVSRQETARPLLTPGEVMQLPPDEEVVMVSGHPPIRAAKLRYYEDRNFTERVLPPPVLQDDVYADRPAARPDDWSALVVPTLPDLAAFPGDVECYGNGGPAFQPTPEVAIEAQTVPDTNDMLLLGDDEDVPLERVRRPAFRRTGKLQREGIQTLEPHVGGVS